MSSMALSFRVIFASKLNLLVFSAYDFRFSKPHVQAKVLNFSFFYFVKQIVMFIEFNSKPKNSMT